jgi:hypothetical protein
MSVHASPDFFHTCAFTYRDGRRCREPRSPDHPTLCLSHARKEAVFLGQEAVAGGICNELKRNYTTACDLSWTLSRIFESVAAGHIKPKTAQTLAYLAQIMAQTIPLAQHEFSESLGPVNWAKAVRACFPSPENIRYDHKDEEDTEDDEDELADDCTHKEENEDHESIEESRGQDTDTSAHSSRNT